ncbi:MAG: glutaredoxin family protein [Burkholderiales bacterium]|nr:glutaredoxin family protein [Burkholderiales bacterium]
MTRPADHPLTLYGRRYCHLCDEMAAALAPIASAHGLGVEFVDVDADPTLEERYGERVPVLVHGDTELCHYFLDAERVRAYLAEIR